jgi:predicted TIM-barrel fold metal-dependent hydrolase
MVSVPELLADMAAAGVGKVVVAGWPWQHGALCREQNTWLMDLARQYPDRVIALATVQPQDGDAAIRELRRCVEGGLAGLGELNADGQGFGLDDPGVMALANAATEMGVPIMLHTNEPVGHVYPGKGRLALADVYAFIRACPELRLVLAHWGGGFPFYELMPEVRTAARHVFYDSAASPLLYTPEIFRTVIDLVGADKVLFGSDYPLLLYPKRQRTPSFSPMLDEVNSVGLPAAALADVLGQNAMRVYLSSPTVLGTQRQGFSIGDRSEQRMW